MAINVRYALTLNEPNLLPADVKRIQLNVHKHDVRIAADSPMRLESKFLTVRLGQNDPDNLKPFPQRAQLVRTRTTRTQCFADDIHAFAGDKDHVQRILPVALFDRLRK